MDLDSLDGEQREGTVFPTNFVSPSWDERRVPRTITLGRGVTYIDTLGHASEPLLQVRWGRGGGGAQTWLMEESEP